MGRYDSAEARQDGLFEQGEIMVSEAASKILEKNGCPAQDLIDRHTIGDWGDVKSKIWSENDFAVGNGGNRRILSYYIMPDCTGIVVVTCADRSETVIMDLGEFALPKASIV